MWTTQLLDRLGITRDSLSLFVTKWCAFIVALAAMGTDVTKVGIPAEWAPYIALVAMFISVSSAQHRTSGLPGEPPPTANPKRSTVDPKRFVPVLFLAFALGSMTACAGKARHVAVQVDVALYEILNDLHAAEQSSLCGLPSCAMSTRVEFLPGWTAEKSQAFNKTLLPAVEAGRGLNDVLRTLKPGDPLPQTVAVLIGDIGRTLTNITQTFPEGAAKTTMLGYIAKAQMALLQALSLVLMIGA